MAGAKTSTSVRSRKSRTTSSDLPLGLGVGADAVLDAGDRLDLALDVRAVPAGLGDDLDRLPLVLLDRQVRGVEEHRVPAPLEALGDHRAVGAVVEVQRDRHLDARRHRRPTSRRGRRLPIDLTVLTDVCTISGDRASTAAASTASSVRSLTMLIAGIAVASARLRRRGAPSAARRASRPRRRGQMSAEAQCRDAST